MNSKRLSVSPFDPNRYIGSVIHVTPDTVKINLPHASRAAAKQHAGYLVMGGQVGELIFIENENYALLGRIIEVYLPDKERLKAEPTLGPPLEVHPIGFVQLLTTLELSTGEVISGIAQYPRIGQHVFSAHPRLVKHVVENHDNANDTCLIKLATIPQESHIAVNLNPSKLFGRHCAILGATGGGKSYTVARTIEEIARIGGKAILLDPTGEFCTFEGHGQIEHVFLGRQQQNQADNVYVSFPYSYLTELDLFAIFQPSSSAQAPKLREALKSLKLINASGITAPVYTKAKKNKEEFNALYKEHKETIESKGAEYLIENLPAQIAEECIQELGAPNSWGVYNDNIRGYCEPLIAKIQSIICSKALECLFKPKEFICLISVINAFLTSDKQVLRISMENLPFEHNAREIFANAFGRYLLEQARGGIFRENPIVVILDEAHQFLNKNLGDESNRINLDAFGLIAKEGRKYGLTTIIATQRPRDIPDDVLSQMGIFIVHRLINERDKNVVEKACGHLDGSAAFLPTLGQGEAILVGVDFPMPTPVKIIRPAFPPKSQGPNYSAYWTTS